MPLYEYQCKKCHSLTERIQKFSDEPLTTCPHCGGELEKLLSAASVRFKGSGWYATDYAKKSSSPGSDSGGSSSSGNGSAASSSSGSKPETSKGEASSSADKSGSGEKK